MAKKLTEEEKYYRTQTERQFQNFVIARALNNGWTYYHAPDNKPDKSGRIQNIVKGFPDMVLVKDGKIAYAELKTQTGRASVEQKEWLQKLAATGADTFIWRPSMWKDINAYLAGELEDSFFIER